MGSGKQTLAEFIARGCGLDPRREDKKGHDHQDQYFIAGTSVTGDLSLVCRLLGLSLCLILSFCKVSKLLFLPSLKKPGSLRAHSAMVVLLNRLCQKPTHLNS